MAETIRYGLDGSASIRKIICDMGNNTMVHISVEADGDVTFDIWDRQGKRRLAEFEINTSGSETPGLAAALAPALREYARKHHTE